MRYKSNNYKITIGKTNSAHNKVFQVTRNTPIRSVLQPTELEYTVAQNEYEYIEFLVRNGLQENSAYSYGIYLQAISRALNIIINDVIISSKKEVDIVIEKLSKTDLAKNYQNNCGTALRKYFKFVTEESLIYKSPDEIENPNQYTEGTKKLLLSMRMKKTTKPEINALKYRA